MRGTICIICNGSDEIPAGTLVAVCRHSNICAVDKFSNQLTLDEAASSQETPDSLPSEGPSRTTR